MFFQSCTILCTEGMPSVICSLTAVIFFTSAYAKLQLDNVSILVVAVGDTMSNLPEIRNGHKREEMANGGEPMSHFQ